MPPKVKISREKIVAAATDLVRKRGVNALNARSVADALGCSTQPVFSNFATMEELKNAVLDTANRLYLSHQQQAMQQGDLPPYKASGMAYIRFAAEEPELFRLLFMRDRSHEKTDEATDELKQMTALVSRNTGLSQEEAFRFHMEMWVYVHGIATMLATAFLPWDWEQISQMLTDAYCSMQQYYCKE